MAFGTAQTSSTRAPREAGSAPHTSSHHAVAALSFQLGIDRSGWKAPPGPTFSSIQSQIRMLNAFPSQASSPKDEDPTMSLGTCFSAEPLSI